MSDFQGIHEECGVFGLFSNNQTDAARMAYYGLYALQHRGQESCGIVVNHDGLFYSHKDLGLVSEVFVPETMQKLPQGKIAVAHCRYGTTGGTNRANCQPLEVNHIKGKLALAHNGNLSNAFELRQRLEMGGAIFHSTSDTETIAYIVTQKRIHSASIEEAVLEAMKELEGAYSLVMMSPTKLLAARDPHGFRPLCYGRTEDGVYVVASESCALQSVGAKLVRDIEPGELVVFSDQGVQNLKQQVGTKERTNCIFEYIYFARPDSVLDGISVHAARKRAGAVLYERDTYDADAVIGVPDSGLDAAMGYSEAATRAGKKQIPYSLGFIKNKYIGRTFISPGQDNRVSQVHIKLNPIDEEVRGKRIILVDDSIVRGTTCAQIVKLLRDAGAKEIHMRISSPPFMNPCYYGTDVDSRENLIACKHSVEEIAEIIGADSLMYLPLEALPVLCGHDQICTACFSGKYPTRIPTDTRKDRFETPLSQSEKGAKGKGQQE